MSSVLILLVKMGNSTARDKSRIQAEGESESGATIEATPSADNYADEELDEVKCSVPTAPAVFRWTGEGQEVFLAGSFDNWSSRIRMVKSHGDFVTIIELPEGTHQYKFLVDGVWKTISTEPQTTSESGSCSNLITVHQSDFEVFDALASDGRAVTSDDSSTTTHHCAISPAGSYTQVIPSLEINARQIHRHGLPPSLPPQLLQYDAALPEFNHVMLNHLYALSIKDGVMAMGSTHRYRKKYVTTLMYKPV